MASARPSSLASPLALIAALAASITASVAGCGVEEVEPTDGADGDVAPEASPTSPTTDGAPAGDAGTATEAEKQAAHCERYEEAVTAFYVRCQLIDPTDTASLKNLLGTECGLETARVGAGLSQIDPNAEACLGALATADCSSTSVPGRPSTKPLECSLIGTTPAPSDVGGDCSGVHACKTGLSCALVGGLDRCGACVAPAEIGQSCDGRGCNPATSFCSVVAGGSTCVRARAVGEACSNALGPNVLDHCLEGLFCSQSGCQPRHPDGASCTECFQGGARGACCTSGFCNGPDAATARCGTLRGLGEACDAFNPCRAPAYCSPGGTCKPLEPEGGACTKNADCAKGYCADSVCGGVPVALGGVCALSSAIPTASSGRPALVAPCAQGAFCKLDKPFATSSATPQLGRCTARLGAGSACTRQGQPKDGCAVGTCRGGVCTTELGGLDATCSDDASCQPAFYCVQPPFAAAGTCKPRVAAGTPCFKLCDRTCTFVEACEQGLSCQAGVCAPAPSAGSPCTPNATKCPTGLGCVSLGGPTTVCAPVAGLGEPCLGATGKGCAPGARCEGGVCVLGSPAGSPAANASECRSGASLPADGGVVCVPICG